MLEIGDGEVFLGQFADGVGSAALANGANGGLIHFRGAEGVGAEHFAGGKAHDPVAAIQLGGGFQDIRGAHHVYAHGGHRVFDDGVNPGNRRTMDDDIGPRHGPGNVVIVEDIADFQLEVFVVFPRLGLERITGQIVKGYDLIVFNQAANQGGADKPRAAGDKNLLVLDHGWSSPVAVRPPFALLR